MITVERLEELIKQGGTVYIGNTTHINLSNRDYVKYDKNDNAYYLVHRDMWFGLSVIYETKKERDWVIKTHTERTERFEPPMWEDIDGYYDFKFITCLSSYRPCIDFSVNKKINKIEIVVDTDEVDELFETEATKENYIKACEIVRGLFNKEENK